MRCVQCLLLGHPKAAEDRGGRRHRALAGLTKLTGEYLKQLLTSQQRLRVACARLGLANLLVFEACSQHGWRRTAFQRPSDPKPRNTDSYHYSKPPLVLVTALAETVASSTGNNVFVSTRSSFYRVSGPSYARVFLHPRLLGRCRGRTT